MARRIAVVLFNLGGPDGPGSVRPFLRNLFRDPAILRAPAPVREALAILISTLRAKSARENYAKMGGGSPLLGETQKQADALRQALSTALPGDEVKCFISMRYWKPFAKDAVAAVNAWRPDEIDAWSDKDAKRLYGYYDDAVFVVARLAAALHG